MVPVLAVLSMVVAVVYVVVLAVTLVLVLVPLRQAARRAQELAQGLELVQRQTADLPGYLPTINGALAQLLDGLRAVDGHYASLLTAAGARTRRPSGVGDESSRSG